MELVAEPELNPRTFDSKFIMTGLLKPPIESCLMVAIEMPDLLGVLDGEGR